MLYVDFVYFTVPYDFKVRYGFDCIFIAAEFRTDWRNLNLRVYLFNFKGRLCLESRRLMSLGAYVGFSPLW